MAQGLLDSVDERAGEIVNAGGFTSLGGLKKVLTEQAQSILNRNGE